MKPLQRLMDKGHKEFYSFDLSAATDRLPIDLQVDVLSVLYGDRETAQLWADLLVKRSYSLKSDQFPESSGDYHYSVGQPMGALSSWGMLALTHHLIVQVAARRTGLKP